MATGARKRVGSGARPQNPPQAPPRGAPVLAPSLTRRDVLLAGRREPPATAPSTEPPAAAPPATELPAIVPLSSEQSSSAPPSTEQPAIAPPSAEQPSSVPPSAEQSSSAPPSAELPAIASPSAEQPAIPPHTPHELAVEGKRVNLGGDFGVVFKATEKFCAVAYDDLSWEWMTHKTFGEAVFQELTLADRAVEGVLFEKVSRGAAGEQNRSMLRVSAFLLGVMRSTDTLWELYSEYVPAVPDAALPPEQQIFVQPAIKFEVKRGDAIRILHPILPVRIARMGPRKEEPPLPTAIFHFLGFVLGKVPQKGTKRRWVLVLQGGTQNTFLIGFNEDCIVRCSEMIAGVAPDVAHAAAAASLGELATRGVKAVAQTTPITLRAKRLIVEAGAGELAASSNLL